MTPEDEIVALAKTRRWARLGVARATREQAQISLRELAHSIPTSPSSLSRWETGRALPRRENALAWARLLEELSR